MITTMAFLKAREGLSRSELVDYYENHHVPLILSLAPAPAYYARNYLPEMAEFDVVTHMSSRTKPFGRHGSRECSPRGPVWRRTRRGSSTARAPGRGRSRNASADPQPDRQRQLQHSLR
ncbi:EthD domain-containing protein [Lentzea aerocolonigenes]|uniref:EthD domain-containing protein n=1 Tax=Lentzea aerocolonigenes TaxID=68170 RepID=UPI001E2A3DDE|nr:EthD domain-containing protein [Lentzea aerocolonigenes]